MFGKNLWRKLPIGMARQRIKLVLNGPPLVQEMVHIMHQILVVPLWLTKEIRVVKHFSGFAKKSFK